MELVRYLAVAISLAYLAESLFRRAKRAMQLNPARVRDSGVAWAALLVKLEHEDFVVAAPGQALGADACHLQSLACAVLQPLQVDLQRRRAHPSRRSPPHWRRRWNEKTLRRLSLGALGIKKDGTKLNDVLSPVTLSLKRARNG